MSVLLPIIYCAFSALPNGLASDDRATWTLLFTPNNSVEYSQRVELHTSRAVGTNRITDVGVLSKEINKFQVSADSKTVSKITSKTGMYNTWLANSTAVQEPKMETPEDGPQEVKFSIADDSGAITLSAPDGDSEDVSFMFVTPPPHPVSVNESWKSRNAFPLTQQQDASETFVYLGRTASGNILLSETVDGACPEGKVADTFNNQNPPMPSYRLTGKLEVDPRTGWLVKGDWEAKKFPIDSAAFGLMLASPNEKILVEANVHITISQVH